MDNELVGVYILVFVAFCPGTDKAFIIFPFVGAVYLAAVAVNITIDICCIFNIN